MKDRDSEFVTRVTKAIAAKLAERTAAAERYEKDCRLPYSNKADTIRAFKAGAKWQQNKGLDMRKGELCPICGQPDSTTCSCPKEFDGE